MLFSLGAPGANLLVPFAASSLASINFASPTPSLAPFEAAPGIAGLNFDAFSTTGLLSRSRAHLSHISAAAGRRDAPACYSWITSAHLLPFRGRISRLTSVSESLTDKERWEKEGLHPFRKKVAKGQHDNNLPKSKRLLQRGH